MTDSTETLTRPNGRTYRPHKVTASFLYDENEAEAGVMVLGTHDVARAQRLANDLVKSWDSGYVAVDPVTSWYRDGFEGGRRRWIHDAEHGRAGVCFGEIVEATP